MAADVQEAMAADVQDEDEGLVDVRRKTSRACTLPPDMLILQKVYANSPDSDEEDEEDDDEVVPRKSRSDGHLLNATQGQIGSCLRQFAPRSRVEPDATLGAHPSESSRSQATNLGASRFVDDDASSRSEKQKKVSFALDVGRPFLRGCASPSSSPSSRTARDEVGRRLIRLAEQSQARLKRKPETPGASGSGMTRSNSAPNIRQQQSEDEPRKQAGSLEELPVLEANGVDAAERERILPVDLPSPPVAGGRRRSSCPDAGEVARAAAAARSSFDDAGVVFIFDWDDTLLPTWYITEVMIPCLPDEAGCANLPSVPVDSAFHEALARLAETVQAVLRAARALGRVGIVTLSSRPWVLTSSKYLPGIDFEQLLKELQIPVVYARECVPMRNISKAEVEEGVSVYTIMKRAAMVKVLKKLYRKNPWRNIISIGDSTIERDALKELLWSHEQDSDSLTPCKTVKLMFEPSCEQLAAELLLLRLWLPSMVLHKEDFDVTMDGTEEEMTKFDSQFCE